MAKLVWDETGTREYRTGIDHVALRLQGSGNKWEVWNGATTLTENPSGAESTKLYADNLEYLNLISKEEFGCSVECYSTPNGFLRANGERVIYGELNGVKVCRVRFTAQPRLPFDLMYRELIGTDTTPAGSGAHNYIYHFVYNCKASPSSKNHQTVNDSPEAATHSYDITTTAADFDVDGMQYNTAHFEVDCSKMTNEQWALFKAYVEDDGNNPVTPSAFPGIID